MRLYWPAGILAFWAFLALFGGMLGLAPNHIELPKILLEPGSDALLGYDDLGRPLWDRLVAGAQTSFVVAIIVVVLSAIVGTLIGADLLSLLTPGVLPTLSYVGLQKTGPLVLSIGGAGVFDGIFLTGIMSVLLAAGIVCLLRGSCDDLDANEAKD